MKLASVSSGPEKIQKKVPAKTPTLLDVRAETYPRIYVSPRTQLRKRILTKVTKIRRCVGGMMHVAA